MAWAISAAVPVVILIVGIVAVHQVRHEESLLQPVPGGIETNGTLINAHEACDRGDCTYQPEIRFSDREGLEYSFLAPYEDADPRVGSTVRVSYDPSAPALAHDLSENSSWSFEMVTAVATICLGVMAILGVGTTLLVTWRRRTRTHADDVSSTMSFDIPVPYARLSPGGFLVTQPRARRILAQSIGFYVADLALLAIALVIGFTHDARWVAVPAAIGLCSATGCLAVMLHQTEQPDPDGSITQLWQKRGLWLMLLSSLPIYISLAGAVASLNHT